MELDVRINDKSTSIIIGDPYRPDVEGITRRISEMAAAGGIRLNDLDVRGLLPQMVRGVAGCEEGCPANAKDLVEKGYGPFELEYIEGGILTAQARTKEGLTLLLKLFPDF
ncbi:MAG: hypothetical protein OEW15_06100 [Nitrospirota bacterium]|nr:hypothetical protein [Nitrospirota bacterium]